MEGKGLDSESVTVYKGWKSFYASPRAKGREKGLGEAEYCGLIKSTPDLAVFSNRGAGFRSVSMRGEVGSGEAREAQKPRGLNREH